jgi:hypothetical protein
MVGGRWWRVPDVPCRGCSPTSWRLPDRVRREGVEALLGSFRGQASLAPGTAQATEFAGLRGTGFSREGVGRVNRTARLLYRLPG